MALRFAPSLLLTCGMLSGMLFLSSCSNSSLQESSAPSLSSPSSQAPGLSEQFEQVEKSAEDRALSEEQRQFGFLESHIVFTYPAVANSPFTFAYGIKNKDLKVFLCDEVTDGLAPRDQGCWKSEGDSNGWRVQDVVNQYPSKVSFSVFVPRRKYPNGSRDSYGRDYIPAKTITQEVLFKTEFGHPVPAKTYLRTSLEGSPAGPISLENYNDVIDRGCTVGIDKGNFADAAWGSFNNKLSGPRSSGNAGWKKGPFDC